MEQDGSGHLDFEVDSLTHSIQNVITHEVFQTQITRISRGQSRQIKKSHWLLDWHLELKTEGREVFKLTTVQNPTIIHGLISLTDNHDHVFMNLIENARFNKGEKYFREE